MIRYLYYYLTHRYEIEQMDLSHISDNVAILFRMAPHDMLSAAADGELQLHSTKWGKSWFFFKNILLLGAPQSRVKKVVYFTFLVLTIELNNPFDTKILMRFLERKLALLKRLLKGIEKINGKRWDQSAIYTHLDLFERHSLLQHFIIQNMHKAVQRQKRPSIVKEAQAALDKGLTPILITEGISGSYWMRDSRRGIAGLFKPFDEELLAPNNPIGASHQGALGQRRARKGCRVGEAAHHEVAAFIVDSFFGFGIVPRTYYAKFSHRTFYLSRETEASSREKTKYGSFQEFVDGFVPLTEIFQKGEAKFSKVEFQLLIVLDLIIGNTDRHTGNILIGDEKIAAIDHGLCFPDENSQLSTWYWALPMGKEPLLSTLVDLVTDFPFDALGWRLKKRCFISENCLSALRERVVLFAEGVKSGLVPDQLASLLKSPYLAPLCGYKDSLPQRAQEQVEIHRSSVPHS